MAITSLTLHRTSRHSVRLFFASGLATPTFYVWRDGVLQGSTTATIWDATVPLGQHPVWDVFDDPDDEPEAVYPDHFRLQWRGGGSAVDHYLVEEKVGSTWTQRARIPETGRNYYHFNTARLADVTVHELRVVAVGADGNESEAAAFAALMVRHPDPPLAAYSYDAGTGEVTITVS